MARRRRREAHQRRRAAEDSARNLVARACCAVQSCGVPIVQVTRRLALSERTARRWRRETLRAGSAARGRPPRCASRDERCAVYRFLQPRGAGTPLAAVQAAFPQLRRADLADVLRRFRSVMRRQAQRRQSRLEWRRPGAVWAADFKERREPLEGRYGWLLSIKDLASRCQLAWEPLVAATAEAVNGIYARLFDEHGPPLVLKSDNGGQFKADATKDLLAAHRVVPLYSPKRHPQYNGGVERANGQVTGYQEALARHYCRPAGPTLDDAAHARELANELARPEGWRGPTARELWEQRSPILPDERAAFLATLQQRRADVRRQWNFSPDAALSHDQAAALDRRAVRDALLAHDLLVIHPRRQPRAKRPRDSRTTTLASDARESTIQGVTNAPSIDGGSPGLQRPRPLEANPKTEEATSSAHKSTDSGQN